MQRGEIWWASLPDPSGSGPGYRRPVLIVQSDEFTKSRINTVIVAVITSNTRLAGAPGNVLLRRGTSGLRRGSVVNVSQLITLDKRRLSTRTGNLSSTHMAQVDAGLHLALSL